MNNRQPWSPLTLAVTHVYLPRLVIPEGAWPHHWNEPTGGADDSNEQISLIDPS